MTARKINLVIIDGQNCFATPDGELFVPGADLDMCVRLPQFIHCNIDKINRIICGFDWHSPEHISFTTFWQNSTGQNPEPFTTITYNDLLNNRWQPTNKAYFAKSKKLLESCAIEVFPPHAIANTKGAELVPELQAAIDTWKQHSGQKLYLIKKIINPCLEQFSIFKTLIENPNDLNTTFDQTLIDIITENADQIAWAGEASSHCVRYSVEDFVNHCDAKKYLKRCILLTNAMSPVPGHEKQADEFIAKMVKLGLQQAQI